MAKTYMLEDNISPLHYELFIEPDLNKFTFQGNVKISLQISSPIKKIILNSSELKILNASLALHNKTLSPLISLKEKEGLLILSFKEKISSLSSLNIEFQGVLNDSLAGFYRSKYLHNNKEKYLATTQFEAPYARKCFPCFDQPDKKAAFSLTLKIPNNLQAISNMPILSENPSENKKLLTFQKTPLMSTYLLYFAVGEFEFIESNLNSTKIRIATTPGKSKQGEFALDLTKKFLKYFEDYSKIPYPLPKLDMIALPDFAAGAMENWGAITFREVLLLFDPEKTSTRIKKRIAEVIAHELWHQWSGNLVTMKWWDDLWLNESFATYMAYKAVDFYFPEWKMWEDFINGTTTGAFAADSLKTTHAIAAKVRSPNEIEEIFDEISYGKGGSVLRMFESYLGSETFQKSISHYLKKFQYKNASASDLWNSIAEISSRELLCVKTQSVLMSSSCSRRKSVSLSEMKEIIESWLKTPGYPLIKVRKKSNSLLLSTQLFNSKKPSPQKIPLTILTDSQIIKIINKESIPLSPQTKWFKLNASQEGFYRVEYEKDSLEKLKELLSTNQLSPIDRWGIQNDLFNIALYNAKNIIGYLNLISSYKNENSSFVLEDIYNNLNDLYFIFFQSPDFNKKLKEHFKTPFQKNFERLGWLPKKNESEEDKLLRPLSLSYLIFSDDEKILKEGIEKFNSLLKAPDSLPPDLKGAIYALAAKKGKFNELFSLYEKTNSPEEKVKLLASLYKFQDIQLLKNSLSLALSDKIRVQDLRTVFAAINTNPYFRPIFFSWAKENWQKLQEYTKTHFVFIAFLKALITLYIGKEKEAELLSFLNSKEISYKKTKANSFEIMQINTRFYNKNKNIIRNYFK